MLAYQASIERNWSSKNGLSQASIAGPWLILKNSVTQMEAVNERIFLMKDLASVEEAVSLGSKIYEGASPF